MRVPPPTPPHPLPLSARMPRVGLPLLLIWSLDGINWILFAVWRDLQCHAHSIPVVRFPQRQLYFPDWLQTCTTRVWSSYISHWVRSLLKEASILYCYSNWKWLCVGYEHYRVNNTVEPPRDKTNNVAVRPAKTQISLGIRPVWSESSLALNG